MEGTFSKASGMRARPAAMIPIADMVIGMKAVEAAELLPRVFSLCRAAQALAVRTAFGLSLPKKADADLARDILRDHVVKMCLKWPGHLGVQPPTLPVGWQDNGDVLRETLFGPAGSPPATPGEFRDFLASGNGVGAVLSRVSEAFGRGEACTAQLPLATATSVFEGTAQENSVAARQAGHPVMSEIEQIYGRGPFWRATAVAYDAECCLNGGLPPCVQPRAGMAVVPAARGIYAVTAVLENGRVAEFQRVTPTDHMLAKGGVMDQTLASIDGNRMDTLAPLVLDILDPCVQVQLEELGDA